MISNVPSLSTSAIIGLQFSIVPVLYSATCSRSEPSQLNTRRPSVACLLPIMISKIPSAFRSARAAVVFTSCPKLSLLAKRPRLVVPDEKSLFIHASIETALETSRLSSSSTTTWSSIPSNSRASPNSPVTQSPATIFVSVPVFAGLCPLESVAVVPLPSLNRQYPTVAPASP